MKDATYNALLQDFENEATLDCGCLLKREGDSATDVSITFCPMHEGARENLETLIFCLTETHECAIDAEYSWVINSMSKHRREEPGCSYCAAIKDATDSLKVPKARRTK